MIKRIESMDIFRATAIVMIVVSHCFDLSYYNHTLPLENFMKNLMANWSACFIFISGYFSYLIDGKIDNWTKYRLFIKKKSKRILLPYLFCSFIIIAFKLDPAFHIRPDWWHQYTPNMVGFSHWLNDFHLTFIPLNQVSMIFWQLCTGVHAVPYWFIPSLLILIFITPLIQKIVFSKNYSLLFLTTLFTVSILIQRPLIWSSNPLHSAIYFCFFYSLGIYFAFKKDYLFPIIKPYTSYFLVLAILFSVLQTYITSTVGNYAKDILTWGGLDLTAFQKFFTICFFASLPTTFTNKKWVARSQYVAFYSFAIFFLHEIIIDLFFKLRFFIYGREIIYGNIGSLLLTSVLVVSSAILLAKILAVILSHRFKHLIGV